ncbi:hypothetical protein PV327_002736 [Microctonus hyperodae]|uniref:beta-N-acetylhexosaminidase n=1 Tax=Microctonus hyperodae TaxID=165561 RepID=A0AA39FGB2_MICHY|nr:hypothetical protein PV327_002736 [Microctonus hyperodae]
MNYAIVLLYWIPFLLLSSRTTHQASFFRVFECINGECQRTNTPVLDIDPVRLSLDRHHTTLAACRLICGPNGGLWPIPTGPFIIGKNYIPTHVDEIQFELDGVPERTRVFISKIKEIFMNNLRLMCGASCARANSSLRVHITFNSDSLDLNWRTNEDYKLQITNKERNTVNIQVFAFTVYGVRHALETLSQLFANVLKSNDIKGLVIIDHAIIEDRPTFIHRGLLIDTARNYLPVSKILRTIDGLAATKMNVLHWHATDSQSFPIQIIRRPFMSQFGSYSSEKIYTLDNISYIVTYAKYRGVRIILELDSPSHAGAGWDWGESFGLGHLAVCVNQEPWRDYCVQPPCGQLNPVNPNTFDVLKDIYMDVLSALDSNSLIHLGGDEVFIGCWNSTAEIITAMKKRGMNRSMESFLQLWSEFHAHQLEILDQVKAENKQENLLIWSSALTAPDVIEKYVDKSRFVIQTWVESQSNMPYELLNRGYKLIISTKDAWYLDHGFWGRTKYHTWRDVYNNRIPKSEGVLGGEVCMWGEYVNEGSLDARVWPRAAALGERLWSDSLNLTSADVESRLQAHNDRLQKRKINADALAPAWCAQHSEKCN